ncbi:ATP-binding protein [Alkalihalobacillus oceani]|uniref:ATP-binding protein n=1 Tax=Halalkalibacter oceani TaxID=1653776 RepID=UPI00203BE012|nr:ATP-binding protein [Halalkalibacter oceani]MCM3761840.1 ATP-binding protein [Halalkalibacter oceani]
MIRASAYLPATIQAMTLDSNILSRYQCKGCHEAVTVRAIMMPFGPMKGETVELTYGCRCEDLALAESVLKRRKQLEKERLYTLFDQNSLINADLQQVNFDTYEPKNPSQVQAKNVAEQYATDFSLTTAGNLLFTGTYGLGKSHLAVAVVKQLLKRGYSCLFISVPKLLTTLKATYNKNSDQSEDELLRGLEKTDCLVLDDIGAEHGNDQQGSWSIAKVFEVVDSRLGKPTIFTTNLTGKELMQKVGARNFSRMMNKTEAITISGEDYRLLQFKNR